MTLDIVTSRVSSVLHHETELTWEDTEALATKVVEAICAAEEDHIVKVTDLDWTLQHPIRERLDGSLFECQLGGVIGRVVFHGRVPVGVHRVRTDGGLPYTIEPIDG